MVNYVELKDEELKTIKKALFIAAKLKTLNKEFYDVIVDDYNKFLEEVKEYEKTV